MYVDEGREKVWTTPRSLVNLRHRARERQNGERHLISFIMYTPVHSSLTPPSTCSSATGASVTKLALSTVIKIHRPQSQNVKQKSARMRTDRKD